MNKIQKEILQVMDGLQDDGKTFHYWFMFKLHDYAKNVEISGNTKIMDLDDSWLLKYFNSVNIDDQQYFREYVKNNGPIRIPINSMPQTYRGAANDTLNLYGEMQRGILKGVEWNKKQGNIILLNRNGYIETLDKLFLENSENMDCEDFKQYNTIPWYITGKGQEYLENQKMHKNESKKQNTIIVIEVIILLATIISVIVGCLN